MLTRVITRIVISHLKLLKHTTITTTFCTREFFCSEKGIIFVNFVTHTQENISNICSTLNELWLFYNLSNCTTVDCLPLKLSFIKFKAICLDKHVEA